jgi:integrase/recombinase XerC
MLIREWIVSLRKKGKNSASSVNRRLSTLKSFFRYLKQKDLIKHNPMQQVVSLKREVRLPKFVKESEMEMLFTNGRELFSDDFEGVRDSTIIEAFYTLGIRESELIGIKDSDIDFSKCYVSVIGKGSKQRLIPFGRKMKEAFLSYLEARKKLQLGDVSTFFVRKDGSPLYPMLVYRVVRKYLSEVSSLTQRSPHVLRHTFATLMLNNGAELNAVKELLGHANLAATEVYTHTTFEQLREIYERAHPRADKKNLKLGGTDYEGDSSDSAF